MPLIVDPDDLSQGGVTTPTDAVWGAPTGREVAITSAGTELPDLNADVYFEVRDHSDAENNGLYRVNETNPTTGTITAFKISGVAPIVNAVGETVRIFGTTGDAKSIHYDTDSRDIYLLEQGNLDSDGVTLQAVYSKIKLDWKADDDLIPHPFPMIAITPEQFEFIDDWNPFDAADIGPFSTVTEGFDWGDGTGGGGNDALENNTAGEDSWVINGFRIGDTVRVVSSEFEPDKSFVILDIVNGSGTDDEIEFAAGTVTGTNADDNTAIVRGAIRSRKLIRTGGWSEVAETGAVLLRQYAGVVTLGSFEDETDLTGDNAYFAFADDPTDTDAAVEFDFTGPVNEAVLSYTANVAGPDGGTGFAITGTNTIARNDGGNWFDDGFRDGGQITIRLAEDVGNNGTFEIASVQDAVDGDLVVVGTPLTNNAADTTMVADLNNRNAFRPFNRVRDADTNGKTYDSSDLPSIGITGTDDFNNRVFRFPLANTTDLKIVETDANIAANTPYTEIRLRYLAEAYNRGVDSATLRDFGIVVDVGTYSQANGVSNGTTLVTSASLSLGAGEALTDYTGGTLILHDATAPDRATHTISGTPVDNAGTLEITLSSALTNSETSLSFTMQRSTPVAATAEEIFEKVQFQLRQDADIDATANVVTGRTADEILFFVGDAMSAGTNDTASPANPNGGGTGVIIEGFDSNDTNRLTFFDNAGTARQFPFVAAGTINFNDNLVNDAGPAEYFMFYEYTERFTNTGFGLSGVSGATATLDSSVTDLVAELADGDYIRLSGFTNAVNNGIYVLTGAPAGVGPWTAAVRKINGDTLVTEAAGASVSLDKNPIDSPDAILVDDNGGSDITGTVSASSIAFDFDYDNNVQGGRTAGTDADIVIRALGEETAAFVEVFGTITRAVGLSFSVVAPLERNFSNP